MSSDSDETQFEPDLKKTDNKRACFVSALQEHTIVLNRSISSKMILAKANAWNCIKGKYERSIGDTVTIEQLKRILNNLKTEIKKKIDKTATGNKKVKLSEWEKDFVNILEKFENPIFKQVPGAISVGGGSSNETGLSLNLNDSYKSKPSESNESLTLNPSSSSSSCIFSTKNDNQEKIIKKRKLRAYETKESVVLSTNELQRLVLVEQLDLIRTQKKREELKLKKLEHELSKLRENEEDFENGDFNYLSDIF